MMNIIGEPTSKQEFTPLHDIAQKTKEINTSNNFNGLERLCIGYECYAENKLEFNEMGLLSDGILLFIRLFVAIYAVISRQH